MTVSIWLTSPFRSKNTVEVLLENLNQSITGWYSEVESMAVSFEHLSATHIYLFRMLAQIRKEIEDWNSREHALAIDPQF